MARITSDCINGPNHVEREGVRHELPVGGADILVVVPPAAPHRERAPLADPCAHLIAANGSEVIDPCASDHSE